jgi:hypothetical protein
MLTEKARRGAVKKCVPFIMPARGKERECMSKKTDRGLRNVLILKKMPTFAGNEIFVIIKITIFQTHTAPDIWSCL